jgi:hypothetical protein
MVHDALPDAGLRLADSRPDGSHHTAGLMSGNHRLTTAANADSRAASSCGTVRVQVTATHAGGFDLKHHLTRPRCWVWELPQF